MSELSVDTQGVSSCPFCDRVDFAAGFVADNETAVAFPDGFPVSKGHILIVPRGHVGRVEELDSRKWRELFELVHQVASEVSAIPGVDGVNVGVNSGEAAGQTIDHAHVHVIPRRAGDVPDPRGGVRWVLPEKADYWTGN